MRGYVPYSTACSVLPIAVLNYLMYCHGPGLSAAPCAEAATLPYLMSITPRLKVPSPLSCGGTRAESRPSQEPLHANCIRREVLKCDISIAPAQLPRGHIPFKVVDCHGRERRHRLDSRYKLSLVLYCAVPFGKGLRESDCPGPASIGEHAVV